MTSKTPAVLIGACVIAAAAGFGIYHLQKPAQQATAAAPAPADNVTAAATPAAAQPETAPLDVAFTDLDGKTHTLAEYKGKLVVVNFWATWCTPCLHEIPTLKKIQDDYGARGLQIVGPAVDDGDDVRKAAPGLAFNYPVFTGAPEDMLDAMSRFGNSQGGLPFSVVIDGEGQIIARQLGEFSGVELAGLAEEHLPKQP